MYGGPDGELGASLRYLSQRYSMPWPELKGLLTDVGTEGLIWHQSLGGEDAIQPLDGLLVEGIALRALGVPVIVVFQSVNREKEGVWHTHMNGLRKRKGNIPVPSGGCEKSGRKQSQLRARYLFPVLSF